MEMKELREKLRDAGFVAMLAIANGASDAAIVERACQVLGVEVPQETSADIVGGGFPKHPPTDPGPPPPETE